jgi:hypothetical protein
LVELRDAEAIAMALHNMAECLIGLNDSQKLSTHQRARDFCLKHGMPALVARADYNINYLYYLRGEYNRTLEGLRATAVAAREPGDTYHAALCAMDQDENLPGAEPERRRPPTWPSPRSISFRHSA